ncbi:hypothetical protein [Ensifer sp.]|jgi:hypothetical protein|uniref:hypothetical protein n=1 Tax=Ensifer sp. TaxID=1872086 RepID=UPI002E0F3B28|nr:hypothetical protein [Ensifer sp.]
MTRSRKKTPISGVTTAESDKPFKKREHRRERRAVADALAKGDELPSAKAFGDPWSGEKDGKLYRPNVPSMIRK